MYNGKKITAVVVTYNRLELVKKSIDCLRKQTIKLDNILIINNGSTDGTTEWLNSQSDIQVITQENVGGSGGFYTGIRTAHIANYDYIWCMDDDVFAQKNCLEQLLAHDSDTVGILCPTRIMNGEIVCGEVTSLNLTNPFKRLLGETIVAEKIDNEPFDIVGMAFEGPLIKKEVIDKIGYPQKEFFILFDDTEYSYRAVHAGYRVLYVPLAILDKHDFFKNTNKLSRFEEFKKNTWKLKYCLRNTTYICKKYGKNYIFRNFGSLRLYIRTFFVIIYNIIRYRNKGYTFNDLKTMFVMYKKGINGELGKM